jgi:hypothetical protein
MGARIRFICFKRINKKPCERPLNGALIKKLFDIEATAMSHLTAVAPAITGTHTSHRNPARFDTRASKPECFATFARMTALKHTYQQEKLSREFDRFGFCRCESKSVYWLA